MASFDQAFARLSRLTNYERKKPDRPHRFDLALMRELCAALGHPERRLGAVLHVAGSKGKGTVASLCYGMARTAGLEAGCYLSPHVLDLGERVQIGGRAVPREVLGAAIARVVAHVREDTHTWFEAFTAAAMLCFAEAGLDACVVEVGLGGRLDSTNVIEARASCITGIELEHTQVLGDSIAAIAAEKAGILRQGVRTVTGASGEALEVIEREAERLGAPLAVLDRDLELSVGKSQPGGRWLAIAGPGIPAFSGLVPVRARFQARGFALAWATFAAAFPAQAEHLRRVEAHWVAAALPPGRFQVLGETPPVVIDGAHTDGSLAALAGELGEAFPDHRFTVVFAVAADKRWRTGLGRLLALADRVLVAPLGGKPGEDPRTIAAFCRSAGAPCELFPSVAAAVETAAGDGRGLLVTGSLYAAGDALRVLGTRS